MDAAGDRGPLFEHWPGLTASPLSREQANARAVLLTRYHGRATSACLGSFASPFDGELEALQRALPAAEPLDRLHELGFTTLVIHHGPRHARRARENYRALASSSDPERRLERIHMDRARTAYRILPAPESSLPERSRR
jgi:hypothetical protein